jgi:CRISPR/Cas system-associated exonuclease Cas4 (RecB family)
MTFQKLNVFKMGHDIHDKWQKWMDDAGILEQAEVPLFSEEYHITGHADGIIKDSNGRAVVEIKSIGAGTIRMEDPTLHGLVNTKEITIDEAWNRIRKPFATHLRQLYLYMHILGIEKGVVLYEWKANQAVKEFQVSYQPEPVQDILDNCIKVKEAVSKNEVTPRPEWATETHRVCKKCPYFNTCWQGKENESNSAINE